MVVDHRGRDVGALRHLSCIQPSAVVPSDLLYRYSEDPITSDTCRAWVHSLMLAFLRQASVSQLRCMRSPRSSGPTLNGFWPSRVCRRGGYSKYHLGGAVADQNLALMEEKPLRAAATLWPRRCREHGQANGPSLRHRNVGRPQKPPMKGPSKFCSYSLP